MTNKIYVEGKDGDKEWLFVGTLRDFNISDNTEYEDVHSWSSFETIRISQSRTIKVSGTLTNENYKIMTGGYTLPVMKNTTTYETRLG